MAIFFIEEPQHMLCTFHWGGYTFRAYTQLHEKGSAHTKKMIEREREREKERERKRERERERGRPFE
jgi:hypothetical protein